jgi:hypothetical protein
VRSTRHLDLVPFAALCVLMAPALQAGAQSSDLGAGRSAACIPRASRAAPSCDPTTVTAETEKEVTFSLDLPPVKTLQCATTVEVEYTQRDTSVSVQGSLDHQDCAASSGEYRLTVSVRDASGELKRLEFAEPWQRSDDQPVAFKAEYPIGENVDLVSVRARQLRCTCAAAAAE